MYIYIYIRAYIFTSRNIIYIYIYMFDPCVATFKSFANKERRNNGQTVC